MASLGRTSGKVGNMLVRPPLPPSGPHGSLACLRGGVTPSRSFEAERMIRNSSGVSQLRTSLSHDSGLNVSKGRRDSDASPLHPWTGSYTGSPARSSALSRSVSSDEFFPAYRKDVPEFERMTGERQSPKPSLLEQSQAEACAKVNSGELVPDHVVAELLINRLTKLDCERHGWLLDGFPRTAAQVDVLADIDALPDVVLLMDMDDSEIVDRLINRRIDPLTGRIYNLKYRMPSAMNVVDRLAVREDDREDVIRHRLETYHDNIHDITERFQAHGVPIVTVQAGNGHTGEEVYKFVRSELLRHALEGNLRETVNGCAPLNAVLFGPPGCGKGTQAELLRRDFGMVHVSTGELLRDCLAAVKLASQHS